MTQGKTSVMDSILDDSPERERLEELTLREVVGRLKATESKRLEGAHIPYDDRALAIPYRIEFTGLQLMVTETASRLDIGRRTLGRCMSHHMVAYFQSLPQIRELVQLARSIETVGGEHGKVDIAEWPSKIALFKAVNTGSVSTGSGRRSLSTVGWCWGSIGKIADALGMPSTTLYFIGAAWSIATNTDARSNMTVVNYLIPEVNNFNKWLCRRVMLLNAFNDILHKEIADESA